MIFLLIITFAGVALFDVPSLMQNKHWHELIIYSILFLTAFIISLLQVLNIKIPSPMEGIYYLFKDLLHLSF